MDSPPSPGRDQLPSAERAAVETRDRLLDAGEQLFTRKGYAGTSVRDITAAAGCNLASINYHFGGKRNLYREVFRRRLGALREQRLAAVETAIRTAGDEPDLAPILQAVAHAFLEPLREEPTGRGPLRLMLREIVDPLLPADFFQTELIVPVNRALTEVVAKVAPELSEREVRLCVQSFLAQLLHIAHAQRVAGTGASEPEEPLTLGELTQHVVRFSVAAIDGLRRGGRTSPALGSRRTQPRSGGHR